ncbi:hypothetical protein LUQ84_001590 [Hamiltosporidium tvaerminnensis]|nr:hypothetical protein LUQ84_001590 [Hamiltosporidium tvaerminnensis]
MNSSHQKEMTPKNNIMCIHNLIINLAILSRFISTHKIVYWFERNINSEIRFYREAQKSYINLETPDLIYNFLISYSLDQRPMKISDHVFTYENTNFISFEVLKSLFDSNTSKNQCGKIECNFELEYILKITKDITAIPDTVNYNHFESLLIVLKYLKAVADKNLSQLLQGIFFKIFSSKNIVDSTNTDARIEEVFCKNIFVQSESSLKEAIISAFINTLMLKHVFCDENLIILSIKNEFFDTSLFNEHIPYKNLLINNFKVFSILENHLKNPEIFKIFKVLLKEININSLIFFRYQISKFKSKNHIFVFPIHIFKAITVSNVSDSTGIMIYELGLAVDKNLEYFTLKNLSIDSDDIISFLKKHKVKGLIFDNVRRCSGFNGFESFMSLQETLEYIEIRNFKTKFNWWINFCKKLNVRKVILIFNSIFIAENFINEFITLNFSINFIYFEIDFCYSKLSKEFCDSLKYLRFLHTLKLSNYESNINLEPYIVNVMKNMPELKNVTIYHKYFSNKFYRLLFQKPKIRVLHIRNVILNKKTLKLNSFNNYKYLTQIFLSNLKIDTFSLNEIFKLENLKVLSLRFCDIESIEKSYYEKFIPRNIKSLYLYDSNLNKTKEFNLLNELKFLENLHLSSRKIYSNYLSGINQNCNLTLKTLCYKYGICDINDLNRIMNLQILEELNLYESRFVNIRFYQLGENCRFLNSLRILNLWGVCMCLKDLEYLRNFKNLQNLRLSFSGVRFVQFNFNIISLSRASSFFKQIYNNFNHQHTSNFLYEEGIEILH